VIQGAHSLCRRLSLIFIPAEQDETKRLYGVYEKHLADGDKQYLVGGKYTIADMCTQPWYAPSLA